MANLKKGSWKKLGRQRLPEIVFFAATVISVGALVVPMWNYIQLYPALYNFSYAIPSVNVNTSQLSARTVQINFTLLATNPTGYSGLVLDSVNCEMWYYGIDASGAPNWLELTTAIITKLYPIGPNSNITVPFECTISQSSAQPLQQFINYLISQTPGGQIQWSLDCSVGISSAIGSSEIPMSFAPVTTLS